jgi:hypothetical protein
MEGDDKLKFTINTISHVKHFGLEVAFDFDISGTKEIANEDRRTCPVCGENNPVNIDIKHSYEREEPKIMRGYQLEGTLYQIDKYECAKCKSTWESDPYPVLSH